MKEYYVLFLSRVSVILLIIFIFMLNKKIKIIFIAIATVFILYSALIIVRPIYIPFSANLSKDTLSTKITQGYFNYCKIEFFEEIVDYKIISVTSLPVTSLTEESETYILAQYDVKPTSFSYFEWRAGNGEEGQNGWLDKKFVILKYIKLGDFYFVTVVGTGL